ncbi:hypothetical protein OJAV_G00010030 [Oryzias javanicus]|uniref:Fibronectin type-III domain-containing protein n=1 Tax=Oryzias javanicus TaxID=123683 RepID=A0A3S2N9I7_ORYJA|nr:hypothetical protein OJAV_G00010030 [Oryzias javanicus]
MLLRTFTAALLLSWGPSWVAPCPDNVMVSCENLKVKARWDCKERHPETSFRVKILSYNIVLHENITKESEYDLSHVVWKSRDICLSFLYVAVTASHGGNESAEAKSNTFSFSTPKTVLTVCLLEFPPVSLVVDKKKAVVTFPNPFRFYKEITQVYHKSNFNLTFRVNFGEKVDRDASCMKTEDTCTAEGMFPKGEENCVTLGGLLVDENRIDSIQMNQTQKICDPETRDEGSILLIALLFGFGVILIVAIIAICKVRAWTMKIPPQLKPLDFKKSLSHTDNFDGKISAVSILKSPEKVHDDSGSGGLLQKAYEDPCSVSGSNPMDSNSSDSSTKTETLSVSFEDDDEEEEEEEYRTPYEFREPVVCQDMGGGDIVITYTGT